MLGALSGVVWGGAKVDGDGSSPRSYGSYPSAVNAVSPPVVSRSLPSTGTASGTTAAGSLAAASLAAAQPNTGTHPMLHKILNDVIGLDDCVVFSYVPEPEADPHEDGEDEDDDDDDALASGMDEMDADVSDDDGMMMRMDVDEEQSDAGEWSAAGASSRAGTPSEGAAGVASTLGSGAGTRFGRSSRNVSGNTSSSNGPRTPRSYEPPTRGSSGLLWSVYYFFYNKWVVGAWSAAGRCRV